MIERKGTFLGCFHDDRPQNKKCSNCGFPLCYECAFKGLLDEKVTAWTSIDARIERTYATFCPGCFFDIFIKSRSPPTPPKFLQFKNFTTDDGKSKAGMALYELVVGTILLPFFGVGLILYLVYYGMYKDTKKFYEKKVHAYDLLTEHSKMKDDFSLIGDHQYASRTIQCDDEPPLSSEPSVLDEPSSLEIINNNSNIQPQYSSSTQNISTHKSQFQYQPVSKQPTQGNYPNSGTDYVHRFCRTCGSQLQDNMSFCGNCGSKI